MADVRDRAQLILITGLLLAVSFVVLTLLLNTVIYTENLASRGVDTGGREALEFQSGVHSSVSDLIAAENEHEHASISTIRGHVENGTTAIEVSLKRYRVERGTIARTENVDIHEGWILRQNDSTRNFTSESGAVNWTLATNVEDVRDFVIRVPDSDDIADTSNPELDAFKVSLVGSSGNRWSLYLYDDGGGGDVNIAVKNGSESVSPSVCGSSPGPVAVNLTNGTVDGTPCGAIEYGKGVSAPYDIEYRWGNRSTGTYNLTVNTTGGAAVEATNFHAVSSGTSPYQVPAVYSVSLDVEYQTHDLRYRNRIRVGGGDSP